MRACAWLVVERDSAGCSVVRELRSMAPLTLVPRRAPVRSVAAPAVVRLVSSAAAPLGGDELELTVRVGPGASLSLHGVAATLALPGNARGPSRSVVRIQVAEGGRATFLPEPTVVTARAEHEAELHAELAMDARLRCREILVFGRTGEQPGRFTTVTHLVRAGHPVLRQRLKTGDTTLDTSPAQLAGRRVLGTELLAWGEDPADAVSEPWWSLVPLTGGGSLATVLADDTVTAERALRAALAAHPGWSAEDQQ
jgi:urease accessory protein